MVEHDYLVFLTNGESIKIRATEVEFFKDINQIRFYYGKLVVGRFNLNNIAGWVDNEHCKSFR